MRKGLINAVLLATATASPAAPAPPPVVEMAVKAAFLPKFAPYVNWPPASLAGPASPIVLCIVGADPFSRLVDEAAADLKVEQHPLVVRRIAGGEASGCQLAFVGGLPRRGDMLKSLRGTPVLTVTDARQGPEHGIIHFIVQGGRVRFAIDDAMAAESNLTISAKLLSLASTVTPRGRR